MQTIPPRSGTGFELLKGQQLKVIDPQGEQVSDFFCFLKNDHEDYLSSGRTFDYNCKLTLQKGDLLYSSKSLPIAKIIEDKVQSHDFMLTPCSKETFLFQSQEPHRGCEGNLLEAFSQMGIEHKSLPTTFNIFMNVEIKPDLSISVEAPKSKAGDYIIIEALEDLIVGLTACSAPDSNNGSFKPIKYEILR